MDFRLTDEQVMLRRTVRAVVDKELRPRAHEWDRNCQFPWPSIRRLADVGVTGLTIPEEYGGSGLTVLEAVFALEEIARGCPNTALALVSGLGLVPLALLKHGTEFQRRKYLPPLASGEAVPAVGMTEPSGGSTMAYIETNAQRCGGHVRITGRKCMVSRAGLAEYYFIVTRFDSRSGLEGLGVVLIDRGTPGLSFGKVEDTLGFRGIPSTDVIMEECIVPGDQVLCGPGGLLAMQSALDAHNALKPAMSLGIAQAAFDETLSYVQTRELHGSRVADFQGIRWHLADMAMKIEAARLLVYRAAANAAHGMPSAFESSAGKVFTNEAALAVTDLAFQLHGGYGFNRELPIERLLREARGAVMAGGSPQAQRNTIAAAILEHGLPSWA